MRFPTLSNLSWNKNAFARPITRNRRRLRLELELLEDRTTPTVLTVNSAADNETGGDGLVTLREAIAAANNDAVTDLGQMGDGVDEIVFNLPAGAFANGAAKLAITLGRIAITSDLTITGLGAKVLTLDAGGASQLFYVDGANGFSVDVSLNGMTLTGGNANGSGMDDSRGGAIYNNQANLSITGSAIVNNQANNAGGGVYNAGGEMTISDSTVAGNSANTFGGGLYTNFGLMRIINSTVSGNNANSDGGGLYVFQGVVVSTNTTITGNRSNADGTGTGFGGGIFSTDDHFTRIFSFNTIIAGNRMAGVGGEVANDIVGRPLEEESANNLVGDPNTAGGLTEGTMGNRVGNGNGNLLAIGQILDVTLRDNGGPTQTHALVAGSRALDGGGNQFASTPGADGLPGTGDAGETALATDQRGGAFVRIAGGTVDIGALEHQTLANLSLVVDTIDDENDADYSAGDLSLREAIALANGSVGADTITFNLPAGAFAGGVAISDIDLGHFDIAEDLTITGLGDNVLTLDAGGSSRLFFVDGVSRGVINVVLTGLRLTGGNANDGGGIFNDGGSLSISDSTLTINNANVRGGGIFNSNGTVEINRTTISANLGQATGGGGIYNTGAAGRVDVSQSTISGNLAASGGGIFSNGMLVTLTNSTVSTNDANVDVGGGINVTAGTVNILSSTIANNNATNAGGGVSNTGATVTANNSIIGDNSGPNPDFNGALTSNDFNLIESAVGLSFAGGAGANDVTGQDPNLGVLQDNGGATFTHALGAGPALNTGDPNSANVDQRGLARPQGLGVDRGAFELKFTPVMIAGNTGNQLVVFDADDPNNIDATINVTGLQDMEEIIGFDVRPADGLFYIVTNQSRVYGVDLSTGAATLISNMSVGVNDGAAVLLDNTLGLFLDAKGGLYENLFGAGERWLRGDPNSSVNVWYFLLPNGEFREWSGAQKSATGDLITKFGTNIFKAPELLYNASDLTLDAMQMTQARTFDEDLGLFVDAQGFRQNLFSQNEKWLRGKINSANNPWYIILPTGEFREWGGTAGSVAGTKLFDFAASVHKKPELLYQASQATLSMAEAAQARQYDEDLGLFVDGIEGLFPNGFGRNERWLRGIPNSANKTWYFILPNGEFREWDGSSGVASGKLLFDFDDTLHKNVELLYDASEATLTSQQADLANQLDRQFGLYEDGNGLYQNFFGQNERWIRGVPNGNGQRWYIVKTNGDLLAYDGSASLNGTLLGNFGTQGHRSPELIFEAFQPTLNAGTYSTDTAFGVDFDPAVNKLRIVSDNEQNLLVDVETGDTELDSPLNGAVDPNIAAAAHSNNFSTTDFTMLFGIDTNRDFLVRQDPINAGTLNDVGSLGVNTTEAAGLEIFALDQAFAVLNTNSESRLYSINLTSGAAAEIGAVGSFDALFDLAVLTPELIDSIFG